MALTATARGTGGDATSSTSMVVTPSGNLSAGSWAVLVAAWDNSVGSPEFGGDPFESISDSNSNTWTERIHYNYDPGSTSAGLVLYVATTPMDGGALTTSDTITVDFGTHSTVAKAWNLWEVSATGEVSFVTKSEAATWDTWSITTGSVAVGDMVIGVSGNEYGTSQTFTADSDTTNGTWSSAQYAEYGATTAGMNVASQYKVQTTTASTQTFNVSYGSNSDGVIGYIVLHEAGGASAGAVTGTATAGAPTVTMWNFPAAGLAEGTGTAGAATVTFGSFAPAGAASGIGTSQVATPAEGVMAPASSGTGTAGGVTSLTSAPVNAYPDAAAGTVTAGTIVGGHEAYAGGAMGFGGAPLAGAGASGGTTSPPPRGAPLVMTVGGVDVSDLTLTDLTFDATIGSVPTASITVCDGSGTLTWPLDPLAEMKIGSRDLWWFSGPVLGWSRRPLFPGWEYTLRAEGWQRNLALSPVYPTTDFTTSYDGPAGTFVSPYPGHYVGMGDDEVPPADIDVILGVLQSWWTGPVIEYDVPYRKSVSWTIRPRGAPLSSVLSDIADRLGYDDVFWIDGMKVLHWRPGYRGGLTEGELRAPIEHIAPFFLAADPTAGGIVPTTLTDSGEGSDIREGVHVVGKIPAANALYVPGPAYGGRDVTSADSEDIYLSTMLAWAYMDGRTEERRTLTAVLPPYSPTPPLGTLLAVEYAPVQSDRRYYLIRSVRASLAVPGEGVGGIEWSIELGGADRRSYVFEAQAAADEAAEQPEQQAVALEVGPVSDMALGSRQYVYAWPEDENGNRIRLTSGRVEWTIWRNSADIGAGDSAVGWWFTETTGITEIVWTEDQPLGFAYIELNCDTPAEPGSDAIVVTAQLLVP